MQTVAKPLTDFALKNLPVPARGQATYRDASSPLCVRVSQGGAKTFIVMLRSGRRYTLGRWGEITLAQAREAARRLKAEKTLGHILPTSTSINEARSQYLAQLDVRENTRIHYVRNLARLNGGRLSDITPRDIHRIIDDLGNASGHQAFAAYRAFFNWCVQRNYLERSPCARIQPPKPSDSRTRILSPDEIKAVWTACDGAFGAIARLLLLTGQRRGEIVALRTEWISLDHQTITLPASQTKNGRQHTFPFGTMTKRILEDHCPPKGPLFPARGNPRAPFSGWSKSKRALDKTLPDLKPWTLHDLRRTFASGLQQLAVRIEVTERLLNHVSGTISGVAAIYNRHAYMDEMREAVRRWEEHLDGLLRA